MTAVGEDGNRAISLEAQVGLVKGDQHGKIVGVLVGQGGVGTRVADEVIDIGNANARIGRIIPAMLIPGGSMKTFEPSLLV